MDATESEHNLLYTNGVHQYWLRNYNSSFEFFQQAAELGHAESLFYLGSMYADGLGVNRDDSKAISYFERALALKNNIHDARGYLSGIYSDPGSSHKDLRKCFQVIIDGYRNTTGYNYITSLWDILGNSRIRSDFFYHYVNLIDEIAQLKEQVSMLDTQNKDLQAQNKHLQAQVDYQPNGLGYEEAKKEFESLIGQQP